MKVRFWPNGFASIKWTVELSPHCPLLELSWADITNVIVSALAVVKTLNVFEHVCTCLISGPVFTMLDSFPFQAGSDPIYRKMDPASFFAFYLGRLYRIIAALITV